LNEIHRVAQYVDSNGTQESHWTTQVALRHKEGIGAHEDKDTPVLYAEKRTWANLNMRVNTPIAKHLRVAMLAMVATIPTIPSMKKNRDLGFLRMGLTKERVLSPLLSSAHLGIKGGPTARDPLDPPGRSAARSPGSPSSTHQGLDGTKVPVRLRRPISGASDKPGLHSNQLSHCYTKGKGKRPKAEGRVDLIRTRFYPSYGAPGDP
ncbi:32701_t:CDS:10, partial [Racocetra persica]